jgi:hypothetical protein
MAIFAFTMNWYKQAFFWVAIIALTACDNDDGTNCIPVSGNIISETRVLSDFHSITLEGVGNIFITQESPQSVRIETHQNILPLLKTLVSSQHLSIRLDECIEGNIDQLDIYISVPDIERLEISGVGNIEGQNVWNLDNLEISISGVGDINLSGTTDNLDIISQGVGNVRVFELISNICEVNLSGAGNVEVTALDELDVTISGAGNVFYKGMPSISTNITGSGNLIDSN